MIIPDRINVAREALRNSGREEIKKSLEAGVAAVYSNSPGTITTEYPNGTKTTRPVSDESEAAETARRAFGR